MHFNSHENGRQPFPAKLNYSHPRFSFYGTYKIATPGLGYESKHSENSPVVGISIINSLQRRPSSSELGEPSPRSCHVCSLLLHIPQKNGKSSAARILDGSPVTSQDFNCRLPIQEPWLDPVIIAIEKSVILATYLIHSILI